MFRALLVCAALGLAGCGGDSGGGDSGAHSSVHKTKSTKAPKAGPSREEQTAGMVSAASPARSAAIAELKFDIARRPEAGKPLNLDLALLPNEESPAVTLELSGSDGLALAAQDATVSFNDVTRAHVYRKSVSITPATDGVFFLTVLATFKNADFADSRSFTIPVIVEPGKAPAVVAGDGKPAVPVAGVKNDPGQAPMRKH